MVELVEFSQEYADSVVELIIPIQQTEFNIPVTLADQTDLQNIRNFYQHGLGNFWVAVKDADVVGTVALLDIGKNNVALRKMFVSASYRGREHRVSSRLLQEALTWSASKGIHNIYLGTTAQFLAAHRFYEKNGFHEISPDSLPKSFPIMSVDTKFYLREIVSA